MPFRSCHCCQEPGRVFVWIVSATTVTKVVEGCVYIRRRFFGILLRVGGEFELSTLTLDLSSNATTSNHLIRLRGSQGIQIWKQRTLAVQEVNVSRASYLNVSSGKRDRSRFHTLRHACRSTRTSGGRSSMGSWRRDPLRQWLKFLRGAMS